MSFPAVARTSLAFLIAVIAFPLIPSTYADPPAHAPAHGWRKKHDPEYVGYTGKKWSNDYGVVSGHCNYETAGAVVGGAVGGAIGSKVGEGSDRTIAILVGSVIGAVVGAKIGRDIEQQDRSCIAHSLELARDSKRVTWDNPNTGVKYLLTPKAGVDRDGAHCRAFELRRSLDGRTETTEGEACESREGRWDLVTS
jgi:surface antigen